MVRFRARGAPGRLRTRNISADFVVVRAGMRQGATSRPWVKDRRRFCPGCVVRPFVAFGYSLFIAAFGAVLSATAAVSPPFSPGRPNGLLAALEARGGCGLAGAACVI